MWKRTPFERFLEIIPGALTILVIIAPIVFSLIWPSALAVFVILFDLYWLANSLTMGSYLISAYAHLKYEKNVNWTERLEGLNNLDMLEKSLQHRLSRASMIGKAAIRDELALITDLKANPEKIIKPDKIYQAVLYTTYKEPYDVLYKSISAVADSDYSNDQIILILATEERAGFEAQMISQKLKEEFKGIFNDFLITTHPDNIAGELKGKGANAHWAGIEFKKYLDQKQIDYEYVIVSIFDADTRPSHNYLAALAYKYLLHPDRTEHSFQPIPLYSNNIWQVPGLVRIIAFGSTFWQLIESARPDHLINFSSQSLSFKTVVNIDYWDQNIVSEDSRTYYRIFFKQKGEHTVIPLFTPVYMDAVYTDNTWQTLKNQYLQKRRWSWGIEHFPYLMMESLKHKEISFYKKFILLFRLLNSSISLAASSLIIALGLWWPFLLSPYFRTTILASSLPHLAQYLLSFTWLGLIVSGLISTLLLPHRPINYGKIKTVLVFLTWILVPISAIIFGAIPAIDAQMRLMLGKYMGFWVTPKKLVKENNE